MDSAHLWRSAARSDVGKVRACNEDAFLDNPEHGLWVVADGMGGHHGGERASRLIVESLAELPVDSPLESRVQQACQCLRWLNRRLAHELTLTGGQPARIMGSTVAILLLDGQRAVCIWAGDSRCYLWRHARLYQLTRDHSLQQRLIDEQGLSEAEAGRHPSAHALTRAVGACDDLRLDILELQVYPGDAFLLCSDGLHQYVEPPTLGHALSLPSPRAALERLFEQVLQGDARDNLTAVVIRR